MAQFPITVTYEETPDYFVEAQRHFLRPRWWMHLIVSQVAGAFVASLCHFDKTYRWKGDWLVWYAFGVGIYLLLTNRAFQGWQLGRHYKKQNKGQPVPIKWEFYDADLLLFTGVSSTRMSWSNLTKIVQFSDGFLFQMTNGQRLWIPKSGLASVDELSRLSELLTSKVTHFERR